MNNKSFVVSTEGNTAQDLQDLIDLAVFMGFFHLDGIADTRKNSTPVNETDVVDAFAVGFIFEQCIDSCGFIALWSEIIDRNSIDEKSYDCAVNYFINLNK